MTKKLPFMSDEFYRAETKRQKKDPKFRMTFDDLLEAIQDRARTLKAQGIASKKDAVQTAKVAATSGQNTDNWSSKVASPRKGGHLHKHASIVTQCDMELISATS